MNFNFLYDLNKANYYETKILVSLRNLVERPKKYEKIEVETNLLENNDQIEHEKEQDKAHLYQQVDEILLRAQNLIKDIDLQSAEKKTATKSAHKANNQIKKPPAQNVKAVSAKPTIRKEVELKSTNKMKSLPVYMKAPYKTEPEKPKKLITSASSINRDIKKVELRKPSSGSLLSKTPPSLLVTNVAISSENKKLHTSSSDTEFIKQTKIDEACKSNIKTTLLINDDTEQLNMITALLSNTNRNDNLIRNRLKSRQSTSKHIFMSKISKNTNNNLPLVKSYYKKSTNMIANVYLDLRMNHIRLLKLDKFDLDESLFLLFKLKLLLSQCDLFNKKLSKHFKLDNYEPINQNIKLDLMNLIEITDQNENISSIKYHNLSDLINYIEAKCNLIDIKFSTLLFDYLKKNYLCNLLSKSIKDIHIENDANYINLLLSLIFNKHTFIVNDK